MKAVVTGQDNPTRVGLYLKDRFIFAYDRVRYVGESVAGVIAVSEEIAEQAASFVEVEYEALPPASTPMRAHNPTRRSSTRTSGSMRSSVSSSLNPMAPTSPNISNCARAR